MLDTGTFILDIEKDAKKVAIVLLCVAGDAFRSSVLFTDQPKQDTVQLITKEIMAFMRSDGASLPAAVRLDQCAGQSRPNWN